MNYQTYSKLYKLDNHKAVDALPTPRKAKRLSVELNKHYLPSQTIIINQIRLAKWFNISIPTLLRFQALVTNQHHHKYMSL